MITLPQNKRSVRVGQVFGRLTVSGRPFRTYAYADKENIKRTLCVAKCECGDIELYDVNGLQSGSTKSCGCFHRDVVRTRRGVSVEHEVIYGTWSRMFDRCYVPKTKLFHRYGGRGISVCGEWRDSPESFVEWSLKNGWAPGLQIDRINNDGNYEPSNCRWVTQEINCNNRSTNVIVKAFGESKSLSQWSRDTRCRVAKETIRARLLRGISPEESIATPSRTLRSRAERTSGDVY